MSILQKMGLVYPDDHVDNGHNGRHTREEPVVKLNGDGTPTQEFLDEDAFLQMLRMQWALQVKTYQNVIPRMTVEERVQYIKDNVLAAEDELHEAIRETSWKPWAKGTFIREEAYVGELVDLYHFVMNLMLAVVGPDMEIKTVDELASVMYTRYLEKRGVNIQRQLDGYDGVSTKCPGCGRAYDDRGVTCMPRDKLTPDTVTPAYCDVKKRYMSDEKQKVRT